MQVNTAHRASTSMPNRKAPVFVLGCPRSGTTLLYHMLLSSGGFAIYRTETYVFSVLALRYGDLDTPRSRERLLNDWLQSMLFRRSGLDAAVIRARIMAECSNPGDFLRIVMESIADQQKVERWADCTPAHLLDIPTIKRTIPDAKILHIIRDGRDTALSLDKLGWIRPMPWDKSRSLLVAGLFWAWMVERGRHYGQELAHDYMELHFEELIANPQETLEKVGAFIDHDLDYDRIRESGIGSVREPNSSFDIGSLDTFNPLGRWRLGLPADRLRELESTVGSSLRELGYDLYHPPEDLRPSPALRTMKEIYPRLYSTKRWLKTHTLLARYLVDTSVIHGVRDESLQGRGAVRQKESGKR